MQRILFLAGAAVAAALAGVFLTHLIFDPTVAQRKALAAEVKSIDSDFQIDYGRTGTPPEELASVILEREEIWSPLVSRPKPKPKPFNIDAALRGVSASRHGIGSKAKIVTPDNANGDYYEVGQAINGVTIAEITKEYVLFKKIDNGKEYTKKIPR